MFFNLSFFTVLLIIKIGLLNGQNFKSSFEPAIIGGSNATQGQFPYQVALYECRKTPCQVFCSGVLYDLKTVVTSIDCTIYYTTQNAKLLAFAGDIHLNGTRGQFRTVTDVYKHPKFTNVVGIGGYHTLTSNLAIMKLDKPFVETESLGPISFPVGLVPDNTICYVAGWGETEKNERSVDNLRYITVSIVNNKICHDLYENRTIPPFPSSYFNVTEDHICAGSKGNVLCARDEGSPLVCGARVVGIGSFGDGTCGGSIRPVGFTNLLLYKEWIKETSDAPFTAISSFKLLAIATIINIKYVFLS